MSAPSPEDGRGPGKTEWRRRLIAAMAFPMLVLAVVLGVEGSRAQSPQAHYAGAAVCFILGLAAMRYRHGG